MVPVTTRRRPGFTLMELAIIIAIVGILAAVGAVKYADMVQAAKEAGADSALANARSALAVAIAKDLDKKVSFTELQSYLQGADNIQGQTFDIKEGTKPTYRITFTGSNADILSIQSAVAQ